MSNRVVPPFPIFTDTAGAPLEAGFIYIGQVNLNPEIPANQIDVYADEALTIPVAQPIRTLSGYISVNGAPGQLFTAETAYSITVRNKNNTLIYTDLSYINTILSSSIQGLSVADYTSLSVAMANNEYVAGNTVTVLSPSGPQFEIKQGVATDNNGTIITQNRGSTSGTEFYADRIFEGAANALWFEIANDGTEQLAKVNAFEDYLFTNAVDGYFPAGTYDIGNANWPFRNSVTTSLKDYKNITIFGDGDKTILRTTSDDGADVLQLNAIQNITFKDLSITAILTAFGGAGSNGVSITNGGSNILIDNVLCFDLPGVDQGSFYDGAKGFTIQPVAAANELSNITIRRGRVKNCGFGTNFDSIYDKFDTSAPQGTYKGISVEVVAEDCWRGIALGAAAATSPLADDDKDSEYTAKVTLINCAQSVIASRWVRANIDAHVITTKPKANLFRPVAADQAVYAANITADYASNIRIHGRMEEADNKLVIGAAAQGGGVFGGCDLTQLDFELDCPSVIGDEIVVVNIGGNTVSNSRIALRNITDGTGTDLINASNTVIYGNASYFSNLRVGDPSQPWDTFAAEANGDVSFLRAGSGSPGVADGFMTIKDINTGVTYRIQLYS